MPPVTTIPYGEAPAYCFPLTELSVYVLFVLCLLHAGKQNIRQVSYLIGGVLFGLLLEYINIVTNIGYAYDKFMIMLEKPPFDIPLWIGVGWGIIMYTARLFTDTFKLSLVVSACMDALLALSIDVSMDVSAYRLHMWTWNWSRAGLNPLTAQWFGIPYANFSGWLYVVFFYSLFTRLLERRLTTNTNRLNLKLAVMPLFSVLASQVALYAMLVYISNFLHTHGITAGIRLSCTLVILAVVVIVGWRGKQPTQSPMPAVTWLVPAWFHVYFFIWLLIGGFYKENTWIVTAGIVNLLIGIAIHLPQKRVLKAMQVSRIKESKQ